jgi:hypothetical protein
MVNFGCSEAKMLTEAVPRVLRRVITQSKGEFTLWQRNRGSLSGLADEIGQ